MAENPTAIAAADCGSDEELVPRIIAGEIHLFEFIVRRHTPRLFRISMSVLHNDGDAEEVVQDTFVSAYQHLGQFAGRARFSTWLMRIALYKSLARSTSRRREVRLENDEGPEPSWLIHRGPTPEQNVRDAETAALLARAIDALPETYRRVVGLRDIHETDTETAARELNITATNVKVRLHRAHAMLRRAWERNLVPNSAMGMAG